MEDLIRALQILLTYGNPRNPTHCEHDVMYVCGISPDEVSEDDLKELDDLGFFPEEEVDGFASYRFGSC